MLENAVTSSPEGVENNIFHIMKVRYMILNDTWHIRLLLDGNLNCPCKKKSGMIVAKLVQNYAAKLIVGRK